MSNIDLLRELCNLMDQKLERPPGSSEKLITFVSDRPGHDFRYAIDSGKINEELGWRPQIPLIKGLERTIAWYIDHSEWLSHVTSGSYKHYYKEMYKGRRLIKKS